MTDLTKFLSLENPVFCSFAFWSTVLAVKMLAMALLTSKQRFRKMVFANPEDAIRYSKAKIKMDDPDVERVRRAHQNDLENILPFFLIGFLYVLTDPTPCLAVNLFRLVAGARIFHTFVYAVVPLPQPSRFLSFAVAFGPTLIMAFFVLAKFTSGI